MDGTLTVSHHQDAFPSIQWPVCDSHFKALIHLTPGANRLRVDFVSPKLPENTTSNPAHSSWLSLNMVPLTSTPPLDLVILLGRDSTATFDATTDRKQREGNGLEIAIRKFRTAAYLWQAFTGEQMYRHGFGRRCFRLEEEWSVGSLSYRDSDVCQMRNEAKVHVIRSSRTVAEIRNPDFAQQYDKAKRKGELFTIAMDAVRDYFRPNAGQKRYVSVLILDAHWDRSRGTILGHAALGGGGGDIQLAIFGSQALHSYPRCLEEVVSAFSDCTRTDTKFVADDCGESGSGWEAANIGIGAHMHETGHLFGCPHQEHGIMLRDYVTLNRTFTCREPYSTRTKSPGMKLCLPKDECTWHRLDCLRFRYHPCFRLPIDPVLHPDAGVQVWPLGTGNILLSAPSGITFIEIFVEGDDLCHHWEEYSHSMSSSTSLPTSSLSREVQLTESELRSRLPPDLQRKRIRLVVHSAGGSNYEVGDLTTFTSKTSIVRMSNGQNCYRGLKVGQGAQPGSQSQDVIFNFVIKQSKLLIQVKIYAGLAVDGLEFVYEDYTAQLFGKRGGHPGGHVFDLDTRRGEMIFGFYVRSGAWLDGIEVITTLGRRSGIFGNARGGEGTTMIPPRGYTIAGIQGSCGSWIDSFGLLISR